VQVYGASKLYNIMVAKAWNEKLKGTGVEAFSAHPGLRRPPLGQIQYLTAARIFATLV
jgi:NAD(P)-dependent dehydrogenase (short-subunit alcohol dehydrogenase family)